MSPTSTATIFVAESVRYLRDVHLPRLRRAVETLPETDLWWRPHPGALAVGNVLLHLEGNVRQWLLSGVGTLDDARDRAGEFAAREGATGDELLQRLEATVRAAADIVGQLDERDLLASYSIQGNDVTGLSAIYHVVEHFSWHVGQVVYVVKARAGAEHGLAFFDDAKVNAARNG
ncbi:MAG: DUF1572 family protein [Planctomycetes bacterium]|nr:DUF1572 family protein [Planctomycetota bacterium]